MRDPLQEAVNETVYWLRELVRAQKGMAAGKRGARLLANRALDRLDAILNDDVAAAIDKRIRDGLGPLLSDPARITSGMQSRGDQVVSEEMRILQGLLLRRDEMENLFRVLRGEPNSFWFDHVLVGSRSELADLRRRIRDAHTFYATQLSVAGQGRNRKKKKARKRDLSRGSATVTCGLALVVGDIFYQDQFSFSYSAGMNAFFQGLRDLWGEDQPDQRPSGTHGDPSGPRERPKTTND